MEPAQLDALVRRNLAAVRSRIEQACDKAGRSTKEVTLVGVSKYVDAPATAALVRAGCTNLGEARPQQLWEKTTAVELADLPIAWRLIGHLQRNKADRTVAAVDAIDSIDSLRLLKTVNKAATERLKRLPILLEVNISGEAEKHGFAPAELPDVIAELDQYPSVQIEGLMTMAAREGGAAVARQNFADLRELRDKLAHAGLPLATLSMGMSGDYEQAILEGSTMIRVGSALWDGIR